MEKYYYYYYVYSGGFGCGVSESKDTGFNLLDVTLKLRANRHESAVVSFYQEISFEEYEKMLKIFGY